MYGINGFGMVGIYVADGIVVAKKAKNIQISVK
jgi:hypothetical protein